MSAPVFALKKGRILKESSGELLHGSFQAFKLAAFLSPLGYPPTTDVDDIKFVINFDYPNCSEDYVHRIGRTARSNKSGTAYTFFTTSNMKQANDLIGVLKEANQVINPQLYEIADMGRGGSGKMRRNIRGPIGRNDMRGGRREEPRGIRPQGREGFGPRNDRPRTDDRSRPPPPPARSDRGPPPERNSFGRDNQTTNYPRDGPNNNYGRENQTGGYGRNQQSGYNGNQNNYNRENGNVYNREVSNSGYNRDSHGYNQGSRGGSGLLSTPQSALGYQQDGRGQVDPRYNTRSNSGGPPPRANPRSEVHVPPHGRTQGPPPTGHNINGQYMNGSQVNGAERHDTRPNQEMNVTHDSHHRGPPPRRYQDPNLMNGPHQTNQQMSGPPPSTSHRSRQMTNAQAMQSLFQPPPPPPPPIPNSSSGKGSLMGPPPHQMNKYY